MEPGYRENPVFRQTYKGPRKCINGTVFSRPFYGFYDFSMDFTGFPEI